MTDRDDSFALIHGATGAGWQVNMRLTIPPSGSGSAPPFSAAAPEVGLDPYDQLLDKKGFIR